MKKNIFALLSMQSINYLVPIIILPYLTQTLGAHEYGALNLALNIIQYGVLFITFGFNWSATRRVAKYRYNSKLISKTFWETTLAKFILLLIACICILTIVVLTKKLAPLKSLILVFFIHLLSVALDPLWFFQGIERLEKISIISSLIRLLNIPLLMFFVREPHDVIKVAVVQSAILLTISLTGLYFVRQSNLIVKVSIKKLQILQALKKSLPMFIGAFILNLYNISTGLILGLVSDFQNVGIFSAASRIQGAALGLFLVLTQVIYPRATYLFQKNYYKGEIFIKKILLYSLPFIMLATLLFYFILPKLTHILLGPEFIEIDSALKILAPTIFFIPYSVLFLHCYLLILGYKNLFYLLPTILLIIHIPYVIYFGKEWGANGAASALLLTEFSKFIILLIIFILVIRQNRSFHETC